MEIRRTLHPGQPGTKKYVDQYGESLVCIRYRYDAVRNTRLTTVELIAEERPWKRHSEKIPKSLKNEKQESEITAPGSLNMTEFSQNQLLSVRIKYGEAELGRLVKAAGGRWNREKKVWELAHRDVAALGLLDRVV
ncbi:MAG: hypothetical protein R2941_22350 [Desulfobacterales bacterium]